MTHLTDLPDELLLHILLFLEQDKPALCQFALVSLRFSSLARPILISTLSSPAFLNPSSSRFDKLLHSLEQNARLPGLVRAVHMSWTPKHRDIHPKVNRFLGKLVSLRRLALTSSVSTTTADHFRPTFLESNGLEHLSEASIKDKHLTSDVLVKYIALGSIKHLKLDYFHDLTIPEAPTEYTKNSSPLMSLDFGPNYPVSMDVLQSLLQYPKALQCITCTIPGDAAYGFMGRMKKMTTTLSPCKISQSLSNVKHSLESLTILENSLRWPGHDGTRLDLHEYESLKRLSIPSELLFGFSKSDSPRDGVFKVLPSCLEYLKITFHFDSTIVTNKPATSSNSTPLPDHASLNWILEVAHNKPTSTPSLSNMDLLEDITGSRHSLKKYDAVPLLLPSSIQRALDVQKIELIAMVRVSKSRSNDGVAWNEPPASVFHQYEHYF